MGRSVTPKYRIEVETNNPRYDWSPQEWRVSRRGMLTGYGKPTRDNIARWVAQFIESLSTHNAHLRRISPELTIVAARIIRQDDNEIVAEWSA